MNLFDVFIGVIAGVVGSLFIAWCATRCEHDGCVRHIVAKDHCDEHFPGGTRP